MYVCISVYMYVCVCMHIKINVYVLVHEWKGKWEKKVKFDKVILR